MPLARILGIADPDERSPVHPGALADRPEPALQLGAETTNGDGFGVGWYGDGPTPGVFRSIEPAWNDANLRELAGHVRSPLFFAHIRAAIGSAVQQTNCHPFRHENWLFMHNGYIDELATIKRDLVLAIDPSLFPQIEGPTDTEMLFYLALTFGLEDDPAGARRAGDRPRRGGRPRGTASRSRSRGRSPPPTARASGPSATPARASRARSSSRPTSRRCGSCIPTRRCCSSSPTTRG